MVPKGTGVVAEMRAEGRKKTNGSHLHHLPSLFLFVR